MDLVNAFLAFGFSPLVVFVGAVVLDDVLGVVLAVKTKTFDAKKLPSFLASQFGTKEFAVVAGAALSAYYAGGDVKEVATGVVVAGGSALLVATGKDIYSKVKAILASK